MLTLLALISFKSFPDLQRNKNPIRFHLKLSKNTVSCEKANMAEKIVILTIFDNWQGYWRNNTLMNNYNATSQKSLAHSERSRFSDNSFMMAEKCQTASYKNVKVKVKELFFERRKDMSREMMKEMKSMRELKHDNINSFIGACVDTNCITLITDYCDKGSLVDCVLTNRDMNLDDMFISSLIHDLVSGMIYLHNSEMVAHGNLRSTNCLVTSRWTLQVSDFGLCDLRNTAHDRESGVSMTGGYPGGIYGGDATDDYSGVVNNDLKPTFVGGGGLPRPSSYVDLRSGY